MVGAEYRDGPETGVIFRVDDAMVRAGMLSAAVTQLSVGEQIVVAGARGLKDEMKVEITP